MIEYRGEDIISIRDEFISIIYEVNHIKELKEGFKIDLILKENIIYGIFFDKEIFKLEKGLDYSILFDYLTNSLYKIEVMVTAIDLENNNIKIKSKVYRFLDLENDPYIVKERFSLTKTTKKDDHGISRQIYYKGLKYGDILSLGYDNVVSTKISGSELGELSTKAVEFYEENRVYPILITYIETTYTSSNNYVGNIMMNVILR